MGAAVGPTAPLPTTGAGGFAVGGGGAAPPVSVVPRGESPVLLPLAGGDCEVSLGWEAALAPPVAPVAALSPVAPEPPDAPEAPCFFSSALPAGAVLLFATSASGDGTAAPRVVCCGTGTTGAAATWTRPAERSGAATRF